MPDEIVSLDDRDTGSITVCWNWMDGPMPQTRDELLDSPLRSLCFTHCCGGVMNCAVNSSSLRDWSHQVLWCRRCGARVVLRSPQTLRDLLRQGLPKQMLSSVLGDSQEV